MGWGYYAARWRLRESAYGFVLMVNRLKAQSPSSQRQPPIGSCGNLAATTGVIIPLKGPRVPKVN